MNTWHTLPENYQHRVYNNTLATIKRQIQQAENTTPTVVITVEAVRVDNSILLYYLTTEVALEEAEIKSTDPIIPIGKNWKDDELHFGMPGGSRDNEDEGHKSDDYDSISSASRRRRPPTELERFELRSSSVDGNEAEDGDDADADVDEEEEASQADDGSTQNVDV
jgi:hypothetical protein